MIVWAPSVPLWSLITHASAGRTVVVATGVSTSGWAQFVPHRSLTALAFVALKSTLAPAWWLELFLCDTANAVRA